MRITRAYTITREVKRILDTKSNKSDYVCRAVSKMHAQENQFDVRDLPTTQLLAVIVGRMSMNDPLRPLLVQRINDES